MSPLKTISLWCAILSLLVAIMLPGLQGGFFFDDISNIVENDAIHIRSLSIDSLRASLDGPTAGPLGRPVSVISFALNHYFSGLDAFAFKLTNFVIHAINGLLVAWLVSLLLQSVRGIALSETSKKWLPYWVGAIWLVHPINILPVMLAVQRMSLLAGTFTLLALAGQLKALASKEKSTRLTWLAASWLLFWPLAILSKETGLLFPLFVLAIVFFAQPVSGVPLQRKKPILLAAFFALACIAIGMLYFLGPAWLKSAYAMRSFTLSERLLTEARVLWFYAAQIIVPNPTWFGLYLDDIRLSTDWLNPLSTLAAITGWLIVAAAIVHYRKRIPALSFALVWFLFGHSMESSILPLEIAYEHRNYVPSIGLIFAVGYFGAQILEKLKMDHRAATVSLAASIPLIVLALFTWLRAQQLGNPLIGPQIEAAHHPMSARANYEAGLALFKAGYGDAGDPLGAKQIRYYLQQSMTVDTSFKFGPLGLIVWSCASARPLEQQWIDTFAYRLQHTAFAPADLELPDHVLKPLIDMPTCLKRENALSLFSAGANNSRLPDTLRARFWESAADYELLVSRDPYSAKHYLAKALPFAPHNMTLRKKVDSFQRLELPAQGSIGAYDYE